MLLWLKSLSFKIIIYFIFTFYHHIPARKYFNLFPKKFPFTSRKVVYLKSTKDIKEGAKEGAFIVEDLSLFQQAYESFFILLYFSY